MMKRVAVSSIVAFMMLGVPAMASAGDGEHRGDGDNDDHGGHPHHGGAPEPITVLGLALGAGGIATARWVSRRSARKR